MGPDVTDILRPSAREAILFDPATLPQARPEIFEPEGWRCVEAVRASGGGRGSTFFVGDDAARYALRHYYRGGLVGRLIEDRYLWLGEERTRSFREYRLLFEMHALGLPVPKPAAARYRRAGLTYRADLVTVRVVHDGSLAESLAALRDAEPVWRRLGATVRRFHDAGFCHADLNAHNVLLASREVFVIDFDRGTRRAPGSWSAANLARLDRSLTKLAAGDGSYTERQRRWFDAGYSASTA